MTRPVIFAALLLVAPAFSGPFSAQIGPLYYSLDNNNWYRDIAFNGPNGTENYSILDLEEISSTVLGDQGILVMSGESMMDGGVMVLPYGSGGCSPCGSDTFSFLPYRWWEINYPDGYRDIPGYEPLLTGWNHEGYLTGILYMEPFSSLGAFDLQTMTYTWDLKVNSHNPEPGTWALLGGGLAALAVRRRWMRRRQVRG